MPAIKNTSGVGAPQGNRNAARHGLYSSKPPVQVEVAMDVALPELGELAAIVSGAALWVAEELQMIDDPTVDVDEVAPLVALYAQVAAECSDTQARLAGRSGLRTAPLGDLQPHQYDQLRRKSARALSLMLSQAASAKERLEINELLVAGRRDREREINPTLKYLAGIMRKINRQLVRHAEYIVWGIEGEDADQLDPAQVLLGRDQ